MNRVRRFSASALFCLAAALSLGCNSGKYAEYHSEAGDFIAQPPLGWSVYLDRQGDDFLSYTFVGPFDPDFFRGVPSLSIRWHRRGRTHKMRLGMTETYYSAEDYALTTLREVYGAERYMKVEPRDVVVSGRKGRYFEVMAPMEVPKGTRFAVSSERGGDRTIVLRRHAYAVIATPSGFYTVIYPATEAGYDKYSDRFNHFVNTLKLLKDGPGGAPLS